MSLRSDFIAGISLLDLDEDGLEFGCPVLYRSRHAVYVEPLQSDAMLEKVRSKAPRMIRAQASLYRDCVQERIRVRDRPGDSARVTERRKG